jgi:hypothetical protein
MLLSLAVAGSGQSKNSNLFVPQKLSPAFMEIMGTHQMYQKMNQIRQLMKAYIKENKLQQVSGLTTPDGRLSLITGPAPFSMRKIVSILQKGDHITKP